MIQSGKFGPMFWHEHHVESLRGAMKTSAVVIHGGRGMEKTALLDRMKAEFQDPFLIDGKDRDLARMKIRERI